jgi:hypothetical protein
MMQGYYERRPVECFIEPVGSAAAAAVSAGSVAAESSGISVRPAIKVTTHVYVLTRDVRELRTKPCIPNYTLALHHEHYKPIQHILVKQQKYLGITGEAVHKC